MILSPDRKETNLRRIVEAPEREQTPEWLKRYEDLKASPLWDNDHNQFLGSLQPNQEVGNNNRYADDQLLYLLFLQQTNPTEAQRLYEQLKASKLWDKDHNQFLWSLEPNQEVGNGYDRRLADIQLLHLLFLQQTNPTEAQHLYRQLKASKLWDNEHSQFLEFLKSNQEVENDYRPANAQLLHLLFLQQTNPPEAQQLYRQLQASNLWDNDHNQFLGSLQPNQEVGNNNRHADDQLLHILFLQQTNPAEAQQLYRQLKAGKLWDPEYNQFLGALDPNQEVEGDYRSADYQLLGILVEKGFADLEEKTPNLDATPPMPAVVGF